MGTCTCCSKRDIAAQVVLKVLLTTYVVLLTPEAAVASLTRAAVARAPGDVSAKQESGRRCGRAHAGRERGLIFIFW